MKKFSVRVFSAATAIALLASTMGIASLAPLASAAPSGPTVTLSTTSSSPTSAATVPVTATFDHSVNGFISTDINVTNGTVSSFIASSTAPVYTFDVSPTADGTVTVTVPADVASSTTGSPNLGNQVSNVLTFTYVAPAPAVTTMPATGITSSDATLNGTNGFDAASDSSFWVSTSTFTPVAGVSPTMPAEVYSTIVLGAQASSTAFSAPLSSATGLPAVTPNTTYYYTAWVDVGGTWTPGAVLSFTTAAAPVAPVLTSITVTPPAPSIVVGGTQAFAASTSDQFGAHFATSTTWTSSNPAIATINSSTGLATGVAAGTVTITASSTGSAVSGTTTLTVTLVPAPVAPVLSNIAVSGIGSTTATVTWTTDLPASTQVFYGTTTSYGLSSTLNTTASTSHSAVLTSLQQGTLYHFDVSSANAVGTTTSGDMLFSTQSTASTTPLHVDGVTPVQTSATADGLFSDGWVWLMHLTVPDNENAFRMSFTDWTGTAGTFPAGNNVRISSPQSTNASTPAAGIISPNNNYGGWMYLTGDTATTTPGRQIDVEIDVRIPVGTAAGSYTTGYNANSVPQAATSTAI